MEQQLIPNHSAEVPNDAFKQMFVKQAEFQKRFYDLGLMSKAERVDYLFKMLTFIGHEQVEACEWLTEPSYKPWKKTEKPFNRYEFINELVDIQHFLINAALGVNCTAEEFLAAFFNKNAENIKRQENAY